VVAFVCFWCGAVGSGFVAAFPSALAGRTFWGEPLILLGMLLFAVGLTLAGFWWEVPRRREDITRILLGPTRPGRADGPLMARWPRPNSHLSGRMPGPR
jgi:hypothetical protein